MGADPKETDRVSLCELPQSKSGKGKRLRVADVANTAKANARRVWCKDFMILNW